MTRLIPEWKDVWKFYSSWAVFALTAWNMLPAVLAESFIPLPVQIGVSAVLMFSFLLVRVLDQPSISKGSDDGTEK